MAEQKIFTGSEFELTTDHVVEFEAFHLDRVNTANYRIPDKGVRELVLEDSTLALEKIRAHTAEQIVEGARYVYEVGLEFEAEGKTSADIFEAVLNEGETAMEANTGDHSQRPEIMDYYQLFKMTPWGQEFMRQAINKAFRDKYEEGS